MVQEPLEVVHMKELEHLMIHRIVKYFWEVHRMAQKPLKVHRMVQEPLEVHRMVQDIWKEDHMMVWEP